MCSQIWIPGTAVSIGWKRATDAAGGFHLQVVHVLVRRSAGHVDHDDRLVRPLDPGPLFGLQQVRQRQAAQAQGPDLQRVATSHPRRTNRPPRPLIVSITVLPVRMQFGSPFYFIGWAPTTLVSFRPRPGSRPPAAGPRPQLCRLLVPPPACETPGCIPRGIVR